MDESGEASGVSRAMVVEKGLGRVGLRIGAREREIDGVERRAGKREGGRERECLQPPTDLGEAKKRKRLK